MPRLASQRSTFERLLLTELGPLLRGTPWKKSKCALFERHGDYYQDVLISVYRNGQRTTATLRFKPMGLDPILWDILGISENKNQPVSFRTWGAFTCSPLPILVCELEEAGQSPEQVAAGSVALVMSNETLFEKHLASAPFSELVAAHPNQRDHGAYAVTLVTSLIYDGCTAAAYRLANAYLSGESASCAGITSNGKTFHELAVAWIEAGQYARAAIDAAAGA